MAERLPYDTVLREATAEFSEKKSRFISYLAPASSEEEAKAFAAGLRARYPDATHHVTAWVLRRDNTLRFSDDGEPSGTAGKPALEVLTREGLQDVALVVVRYFGGTLLGAGGLTRAYARAAKLAVEAADRVRMVTGAAFCLRADYAVWPRISRALPEFSVVQTGLDFGAEVIFSGVVESERFAPLCDHLRELSAGAVLPEITGEEWIPIPIK